MAKSTIKHAELAEKLKAENKLLQHELREVNKAIVALKSTAVIYTGDIDGLVTSSENQLKVYTGANADKTYRILIEKMHEGAVTVDKEGMILYANSYFADMINVPLSKVIGTKFKRFLDDNVNEYADALFENAWLTPIKSEVHLRSEGKDTVPALISLNALSVDGMSCLSIIVTDLTTQIKNQLELKDRTGQLLQKNAELEIANKDLTAFTYVSSHDLQEPLRKIQLFVGCLQDEELSRLSDSGRIYLQKTFDTATRMRVLINDLLEYSRTANAERKFEKVDLSEIIEEVKMELKESLLEKNATISFDNVSTLNIIRFQFRQLMFNLIGNTLKFSRPGIAPHIIIKDEIVNRSSLKPMLPASSEREADSDEGVSKINYWHITYADNGIGFDQKYATIIFDVFRRLHSNARYNGSGIGLSICKRIAENHGGFITATGRLNEGAQFDIYIPVSR
ncbi:MAG: ATP-binding protein [Chryseolinea sp.]